MNFFKWPAWSSCAVFLLLLSGCSEDSAPNSPEVPDPPALEAIPELVNEWEVYGNGMTVDGDPYQLFNKYVYTIKSGDMTVHLYNDKRNKQGKAMGKWWIEINANEASIKCDKPGKGG